MRTALALAASVPIAFVALAGCDYGDNGVPYEPDPAAGDEQELVKLDGIVTESDGAVSLAIAGQGSFDCDPLFEHGAAVRAACKQGSHRVELIHKGDHAVVVDRPKGAGSAASFFACKTTGKVGRLPQKIACEAKKPTARPGGLSSPFASTVPGVSTPNAHPVGSSGLVMRGMAPRDAEMAELRRAGVKSVLVFKNATGRGDEVGDELAKWNLPAADALHVPFAWKSLPAFGESCRQTVTSLAFVAGRVKAKHPVFFHCTVGEDRTGYLAALHRAIAEKGDAKRLFDEEMCENGYGAGNPLKPIFVVAELDRGLTPLYRKMAWLVKTGRLDAKLDASACDVDPDREPDFARDAALAPAAFTCGTSTAFEP